MLLMLQSTNKVRKWNSYFSSMRSLVMLTVVLCPLLSSAQSFTLEGSVTDAINGESLPGVIVSVSPAIGTATNGVGYYSLAVPAGTQQVNFHYTGYADTTVEVTGSTGTITLLVQLRPKIELINQIVVSSSKFEQRLSEVTVSMEVLKPDAIDRTGGTSLSHAVERISGVGIVDGQANIRSGAGYSYGAGTRVLILLDGLPILSGDAGFPSWGFLPIENCGQVEVIKGAASALYGSAAMNGVINLRTAYPTSEPRTLIKFYSGVFQNPRDNLTGEIESINGPDTVFAEKAWWGNEQPVFTGLSVSHRQKVGPFDLVAGTYLESEDHYRMGEYDRTGRFHISTRYRPKNNPSLSFGLNTLAERTKNATFFLWNGTGSKLYLPFPNTITNNNGHKFTLDPFATYFDNNGNRHKLTGRWYRNFNRTDRDQSTMSDLLYGEYQFQRPFDSLGLTITTGVAGKYADVDAELYQDSTFTTSNLGVFLQADKKFGDRLNLAGGARFEYNELDTVQEARPVFRLGASFALTPFSFLRASFGQGYRFPTIAEKFVRTDVGLLQIFPNPNLISETGWTAEVGFKQGLQLSNWQGFADIALFWQQYQDMMEFTFGGETGTLFGFQSINVGETRIAGFEATLAGTGKLGPVPLDLTAGYTYADPVFADFDSAADMHSTADHNVLKYRFRHTATSDVETHCGRVSFGLSARYYSFMEAMDEVFVIFVPGIQDFRDENNNGDWVFDARIGVTLGDAQLWLIVSNLFNNEYTIRPALIEAPRNYVLRLNLDLKGKEGLR